MKDTGRYFPDSQISAAVDVFDSLAAGRPIDPAKLGAAMPVINGVQKVMDAGSARMTVFLPESDKQK